MAKAKTKTKDHEGFQSELAFHQREWRIQRIGWVFIALVPLLALAGFFGGGPLSEVRVTDAAVGTLQYERFVRRGAGTVVTIEPGANTRPAKGVRVALASDYLRAFRIEQITPEPSHTRLARGQVIYEFEQAEPGATITFHLQPQEIGTHRTELTVGASAPVTVRQFTYP